MNYSVVLKRTGEVFTLDETNGQVLFEQWLNAKRPFPVELPGGVGILSNEIARVSKNKDNWLTPDIIAAAERSTKIAAGKECRGSHSIQNEINKLAQKSGRDWPRKVQDDNWREAVRQKLLATGKSWCDYKAGTCVCA